MAMSGLAPTDPARHEPKQAGAAIAVHTAPHAAAEVIDAYEWAERCEALTAKACVMTTRCSHAAKSIPRELAIPPDRLQHVSTFFEVINLIRGKTTPVKAIARVSLRIVARKILGALGRRLGAAIGAMFSPPGAVIVGAAIGIWIGCTLAHILSAAI